MKTETELWINFLENERMDAESMNEGSAAKLRTLCEALAKVGKPDLRSHKHKLQSRRLVCETAMSMWIDLPEIKSNRGRPLIGRGLLDAWNLLYTEKHGTGYTTAAMQEAERRNNVTKEKP